MSDAESGTGDPNVTEEQPPYYYPPLFGPSIPHYYGDYVRQMFMLIGVAMLVLAPFLIDRAPQLLPFEIGGAVALVILAALTNPKKQWVILADILAAALGVLVFEWLAILAFSAGSMVAFAFLEAVAIAFLFALYFGTKTYRNMLLGQLGKQPTVGEYLDE